MNANNQIATANAAGSISLLAGPPEAGSVIQDTRTKRKIKVQEVWSTGHCWGLVVEGDGYKEGPHWKFCTLCG